MGRRQIEKSIEKHGVPFDEAKSVFNDPLAVTINDFAHSANEERYLDIGLSSQGRVLVVWYTERNEGIRTIGCRKATHSERQAYEKER